MLREIARTGVSLTRGLSREILREKASVKRVDPGELVLRVENFTAEARTVGARLVLNSMFQARRVFFAVDVIGCDGQELRVGIPTEVHVAERRDRVRASPVSPGCPREVITSLGSTSKLHGRVADFSAEGLGLECSVPPDCVVPGDTGLVQFVDGSRAGTTAFARLCNVGSSKGKAGWTRLGLQISAAPFGRPLAIERRARIGNGGVLGELRTQAAVVSAGVRAAVPFARRRRRSSGDVEVVDFAGHGGEMLRGILDRWGDVRDPTAVLIPPAWGKTKETLLPLAATIVETFRHAGEPVVVLRFDGRRKRGESHNDIECFSPGSEQHHFTFSQGVRDIRAALSYLHEGRELRPRAAVLVTFSAASIEGRRAAALEPERLSGWVSVVGAADLQSAMREVSGGTDFLAGVESGLRFGLQEIQGVEVDMDRAALDALQEGLAFTEDARRDMSRISAPVTWIHGQFDAWMDLGRCRDLMSVPSGGARRLLVVPTGHQLRSSRAAISVFQLIAVEIGRIALGKVIEPKVPDLLAVRERGRAERGRLKSRAIELKSFWSRYLLGRPGAIGIELMTATSAYSRFMEDQIKTLALKAGARVLDLGSGTGSFTRAIAESEACPAGIAVTEVDFVREALGFSRAAYSELRPVRSIDVRRILADLGADARAIPVRDATQDAVLASLLLSYLDKPTVLLEEAKRVLKPGGRLVLSTLRPDADTSKIFREGAEELRSGMATQLGNGVASDRLEQSLRSFLNDAATLLDLEEQGVFRFWDRDELASLLGTLGFHDVRIRPSLGRPPQALIASGIKSK